MRATICLKPSSFLLAARVDSWVCAFLALNPYGTVIELGVGLNSRFERTDNGHARWFELDLPDDTSVTVDIPEGTQPGDVLVVKGRGAPRLDGRGRGALKVFVQVEVPKALSPRARQLLQELQDELGKKGDRAGA